MGTHKLLTALFALAHASYFATNGVAAMPFPTTVLPARSVGQDETVELNGRQREPGFPLAGPVG